MDALTIIVHPPASVAYLLPSTLTAWIRQSGKQIDLTKVTVGSSSGLFILVQETEEQKTQDSHFGVQDQHSRFAASDRRTLNGNIIKVASEDRHVLFAILLSTVGWSFDVALLCLLGCDWQ